MARFLAYALIALTALGLACGDDANSSAPVEHEPSEVVTPEETVPDLEHRPFPLLIWSAWVVEQEYFDPTRFDPREQLQWATRFIGLQTPEFLAEPTADGRELHVTVRSAEADFPLHDIDDVMGAAERLEAILKFTQSVLDLEEEPLHELEYMAINGLFIGLDPHTVLLTPEQHTELGVRTRGQFAGIGAEIRAEARRIRIVRVIDDGPADEVGVRGGDLILRIDEESTVNMTAREAQKRLRGPVEQPVDIRVQRGQKLLNFRVVRDVIKLPSVTSALLPGRIAYVGIARFQENTGEHLARSLREAAGDEGLRGVVLDLRGNSGGLLTQAVVVLDHFVRRGELVIVRSAMGKEVEQAEDPVAVSPGVPVVALIDQESASASEIVSGGLQALGRGVVVGRTSYGKGTVQMLKPQSPYGRELALKLTVAEYRVAGDRRIQTTGVVPDLALWPVELSELRGVARYYDLERFDRLREHSRPRFPAIRPEPESPKERRMPERSLHYLWNEDVPRASLPKGVSKRDLPEELQDPEVRIARHVVHALADAGTDHQAWLGHVPKIAGEVAQLEDQRIEKALRKRYAIDWSGEPGQQGDLPLAVTANVDQSRPVVPGEPFVLDVAMKNEGETVARRVHLITNCAHEELDGIELLVGDIPPGKTVHRQLELQVMPWRTDFTDAIELDVHEGEPGSQPDGHARVMFTTKAPPLPAFRYDYWVVDDPSLVAGAPKRPERPSLPGEPNFEVAGNGDGLIAPGERVLLAFTVQNDGPGSSRDTHAILRNLSGSQGLLEEGSMELQKLATGKQVSGAFAITVNEDAKVSLPFELELAVGDAHVRENVRDKLRFRVMGESPPFVPGQEVMRVGDDGARLYNGAHASSPVVGHVPPQATLEVIGRIGAWAVVEADRPGRRLYVPGDLLHSKGGRDPSEPGVAEPAEGQPRAERKPESKPELKVVRRFAVSPPDIGLDPVPLETSKAEVEISGTITHPERARDVMVVVLPPGPARIEQKVHYHANPQHQGEQAKRLRFSATVPLEPGSNRISIIARDGAKVERRREVSVYRDAAGSSSIPVSDDPDASDTSPAEGTGTAATEPGEPGQAREG